jgi:sortase A
MTRGASSRHRRDGGEKAVRKPEEHTSDADARQSSRRSPARRIVRIVAALMVIAALVLFGNVAWQLWGTGLATARDQHRLSQQFNSAPPSPSSDVVPTPASSQLALPPGTLFGHLVIPRIGVNYFVVEGVGSSQLAEGPGHYPGTAAIGGSGNVGIAGHRTTHGAPFYDLNELTAGDLIYLTNLAHQTFTYRVTTQFVVAPSDGAVLNPTPRPSLTLTTCNPRYSAAQRLIVRAALVR